MKHYSFHYKYKIILITNELCIVKKNVNISFGSMKTKQFGALSNKMAGLWRDQQNLFLPVSG